VKHRSHDKVLWHLSRADNGCRCCTHTTSTSTNWRERTKRKGNEVPDADCFLMRKKYLPHRALNKKVVILQWTLKEITGG
jgi:hypothetical protein